MSFISFEGKKIKLTSFGTANIFVLKMAIWNLEQGLKTKKTTLKTSNLREF